MELIDNRYKIKSILEENLYHIAYKVIDIWDGDRILTMILYSDERQCQLIKYFMDNFIDICRIKHAYLLESRHFNIIRTINGKPISTKQYYTTTEHNAGTSLNRIYAGLNLEERLHVILQACRVLDFLHHRGISYKHLSPSNIYLAKGGEFKIKALSTIYSNIRNANYNDLTRYFIAPELLLEHEDSVNKNVDKYSLGMLMKYLLMEDFHLDKPGGSKFKKDLQLKPEQKKVLNSIITDWTKKNAIMRKGSLVETIQTITDIFDIEYRYDLAEERGYLDFNTKIIGREREVSEILNIGSNIENEPNLNRFVLVEGDTGVGKSRLLKEVNYQLKARGRRTYSIELMEGDRPSIHPIIRFLRQTIEDVPGKLLDKYRDELARVLPELKSSNSDRDLIETSNFKEELRLYDRISRYLGELSWDKPVCLIIDNLEEIDSNSLSLLEYIKDNFNKGNIILILSYNSKNIQEGSNVDKFLRKVNKDEKNYKIKLHNLNLQGIEELVKHILGINYHPLRFSAFILRETQGNPKHMEYILKKLFIAGELFCNRRGQWEMRTERYSDIPLPVQEKETLKNQIELLKEECMNIMEVISLCKTIVSKNMLVNVLNIDTEKLDRKLHWLIGTGLLEKRVADWGYSYNTKDMNLEKYIYNYISQKSKVEIHSKIALFIEKEYGDNFHIVLEELIYHLIASNQPIKALNYIVKGAKNNIEMYGIQALYLWEEAYEISQNIDYQDKLVILENLARSYEERGKNNDAMKIYTELLIESSAAMNTQYMVMAKIGIGNLYLRKNLTILALKVSKEAIELSKSINYIEGEIKAKLLYNYIHLSQGKAQDIRESMEKILGISMENKLEDDLGNIYNLLGIIDCYQGAPDKAVEYFNKSIAAFKRADNSIEIIKPINNMGNIYAKHFGENKEAMKWYQEALNIAENHRVAEMEMIVSNNIGENYIDICEYDKAIEYIEKAKNMAIYMETPTMVSLANINLCLIYLLMGNCVKAYNTHIIIQEGRKKANKYILGKTEKYYKYLGEFYLYYGKIDKAVENYQKALKMYEKYNYRQYLMVKSRLALAEYIKNPSYGKTFLTAIRIEIEDVNLAFNRRRILLDMALILYQKKHIKDVTALLEEDLDLKEKYPCEIFNYTRNMLLYLTNSSNRVYEDLALLEERLAKQNYFHLGRKFKALLGFKFFEEGEYYQAINYLLEALDLIHQPVKYISDKELQISYIKRSMGDYIKRKISDSINIITGCSLKYISTKDLELGNSIEDYFDYNSLLWIMDDERFEEITRPYFNYKEVNKIHDTESLISAMTGDYEYNIEVILKYIARETLAKRGYVLIYNDEDNEYLPMISLGANKGALPNKNLLALANRSERGVLIGNNLGYKTSELYESFLPQDTRALLCIPIRTSKPSGYYKENKRQGKLKEYGKNNNGYIYIETDNIINRFDYRRHNLAYAVSKLININIESYKFKTLSIVDKLTGLYTRKHFEDQIVKIIEEAGRNEESFALIMLDIDKFKNINDIYGHGKGDEILGRIGSCLKSSVRSTDLASRYGGEEFIIVLRNIGEDEAMTVGEKIRHNIESMEIPRLKEPITISLGISMYPKHSEFKGDLIDKADQALYGAKQKGRNMAILWSPERSSGLNRVDKLAGIISGNIDKDQRGILSILNTIELIKEKLDFEEKVHRFLNNLAETLRAKDSSLLLVDKDGKITDEFNGSQSNKNQVHNNMINLNIVKEVILEKKGNFLIDWENINSIANITNVPNWQSVIVVPLIVEEELKAVTYVTVPIKEREFDYDDYNLGKTLCNIFSAAL